MAIAIDTYTQIHGWTSVASPITGNHSCSGSNRGLTVFVQTNNSTCSGVTYNGVAMTQISYVQSGASTRRYYAFHLINPASGSNTISVSISGTDYCAVYAISTTGQDQTTQPDTYVTHAGSTSNEGTPYSTSPATTTKNTLLLCNFDNYGSTAVASTNTTGLQTGTDQAIFISSGVRASGSNSLTVTMSAGTDKSIGYVLVAIGEGTVPSANGNFLAFM